MGLRPRSVTWLSALGIALFQVVGSFGAADNQPERRAMDAAAVLLVLLGPAALAFRDRWPLVAVAVTAGAVDVYIARGYAYGPIFLSVVVALYAAVRAGHRRSTWLLATAAYAGFALAHAIDPRAGEFSVPHMALVAGWLAVVLAVSEVVRVTGEQTAAQARAEEEERQRRIDEQRLSLAQELHDVLAHNISLINVQASVALHLIDDKLPDVRPALSNIKDASRDALHELRTALDVLRQGDDAPRSPAPRLADLDTLVAGVRASGLDVRLERDEPVPPVPAAVELAAYRIVQEALTNVTRHAQARRVSIHLGFSDGVRIEVIDDGVGGDRPAGRGITGMRQRAGALGGTLEAGPGPGGGFRIAAHLPSRQS